MTVISADCWLIMKLNKGILVFLCEQQDGGIFDTFFKKSAFVDEWF